VVSKIDTTHMVHDQQPAANKSARQTRELVRRLGKLTEAQAAIGWGVILLIITLLGAIYLNQSSKIAAVGRHVQELEFELDEVKRENTQLEREIAEAQSLDRLYGEVGRMGFVPADVSSIEYLVIPNYPSTAAPPVALIDSESRARRPVETMREALQIVLQDRLDDLMRGESGE
jgi:cell division protein FtsL